MATLDLLHRPPPQVSFVETDIEEDSFFGKIRSLFAERVLETQLERLKESGAYDAFQLNWHPSYDVKRSKDGCAAPGGSPPGFIWASDVGKWMEATCYFLAKPTRTFTHASAYRKNINKLITDMKTAQEPDGYLNAYFQVADRGGKLKNLRDMCEGYSCGHLIEAALAHYHLTGSQEFLDVMIKCFIDNFGSGPHQRPGYPGHPELELAALRLYRVTKDPSHLKFARYLLEERGKRPDRLSGLVYLDWEADERGDNRFPSWIADLGDHSYSQSHKPLHQQSVIVGHSVQAFYLLTAAADIDSDFLDDAHRLFRDAIRTKMYVTGGFGSDPEIEGFHEQPHYLPQSTEEGGCYAETCASISAMMVAERLLSFGIDAEYRETMETCLYNNVLGGTSLDAQSFYYWNKLASSGLESCTRDRWYEVCCCPPNLSRTIGMLGGYIWTVLNDGDHDVLNVHIYASASRTIEMEDGKRAIVQMQTQLPWQPGVKISVTVPPDSTVRINSPVPKWADNFRCSVSASYPKAGYIQVECSQSTSFELSFTLPVRILHSHPKTSPAVVTVARGPVIYCAEDADNPKLEEQYPHFENLGLSDDATFKTVQGEIGGVQMVLLKTKGVSAPNASGEWANIGREVTFVPFFARENRKGKGHHRTSFLCVGR